MTPSKLHLGDCLDVLKSFDEETVDLVYLDPPFFTQKTHSLLTRDGRTSFSFDDLWVSHSEYVRFLMERIGEMHRCLKRTGSIFFHCNDRSSHLARFVLDEIFGESMFRSEIIWTYRRWSNSQKGLLPAHQSILFYSKSADFTFNQITTDYSESTNIDQILQKRRRDGRGKAVYARDEQGDTIPNGSKKGVPLSDVWDIPYLNPKAKERVGYPTQKPVLLLNRILDIATNPSDLVLDPFCGSGTTLVAAKSTGRRGIGIDSSPDAIELAHKRIVDLVITESRLLRQGRGSYARSDLHLLELLRGAEYYPVQRNKGVDAILKEEIGGRPVLIRIQRDDECVTDAVRCLRNAASEKGESRLIVIATNPLCKIDIGEGRVTVIRSTLCALRAALEDKVKFNDPHLPNLLFEMRQSQLVYSATAVSDAQRKGKIAEER